MQLIDLHSVFQHNVPIVPQNVPFFKKIAIQPLGATTPHIILANRELHTTIACMIERHVKTWFIEAIDKFTAVICGDTEAIVLTELAAKLQAFD